MKILLFGKNGQLGWELQRSLAPLGELIALDRHCSDYCGDLANLAGIADTVAMLRPDLIVNAAAYTAVDKAESDSETARRVNAEVPGVLAEQAKACGSWLVHYSTDYVFDGGGKRPWREDDDVAPLNVYGQSKLDGERAVQAVDCNHLIFRTSWVYAARGNNFAKTMLRLGTEREQLAVIADQFGAPTGAELIADVTAHAVRGALSSPELGGIYHLAAAGETSWHAYAQFVFEYARGLGLILKTPPQAVAAIPSIDYPTPARRPLNSRLDCSKLAAAFDLHLPAWQHGVARMLAEVLA